MLALPLAIAVLASMLDLRHREIPDRLSVGVGVCGLAAAAIGWTSISLLQSAVSCLIALAIAIVLAWRGGFGGGDVKLLAGLASWLPLSGVVAMLFWSAIAGMGLSILALLRGKKDLAYGPSIAAGFGIAAFLPGLLPYAVESIRSVVGIR